MYRRARLVGFNLSCLENYPKLSEAPKSFPQGGTWMAARTAKGRGSTSHARHADAKRVHGTAPLLLVTPLYREKLITEQATYQKVGPPEVAGAVCSGGGLLRR